MSEIILSKYFCKRVEKILLSFLSTKLKMVFPVKVPYTVSADISKYQGVPFNVHPDQFYLDQKKKELLHAKGVVEQLNGSGLYVKMASQYCGLGAIDQIDLLATHFEEDLAVLHKGQLAAICFCFPSGFVPAEKIGQNFYALHLPVADGQTLRASSDKVTQVISREGSMFRRYVWTISSLGSLSQHPSYVRPMPGSIEDLYFRTETQTTVGLGEDVCLFFVKVDMRPLTEVWLDQEKKQTIKASINSMTEDTLTYKNLHHIKQIINQ